jgi:DNA-binding transcriptional regulator YhcF (GntR family)
MIDNCIAAADGKPTEDATRRRYLSPQAFLRARRKLAPYSRLVIDELVERYKRAADEKPVALTVRQLATSLGMSRATAARTLRTLKTNGFIVTVSKSSYYDKRKPSRYRLTMFPCEGKEATHDHIQGVKEWRRAGRRRKPQEADPLPAEITLIIPRRQYVRAIEDAEEKTAA